MNRQQLDPTHSFDVADAIKFNSVEKALIMKEIRGMQLYKLDHGTEGWVYYSAAALCAKFPYMKRQSVDRWMKELVEGGHLEETVQNKAGYDRTKSYRLPDITIAQNEQWSAQNEQSIGQNEQSNAQNGATIPPHSPSHTTPQGNNSGLGGKPLQHRSLEDQPGVVTQPDDGPKPHLEAMREAAARGLKPWQIDKLKHDDANTGPTAASKAITNQRVASSVKASESGPSASQTTAKAPSISQPAASGV